MNSVIKVERVKPIKRQLHKMVKHTQVILLFETNCLNLFDYFWGLVPKGLKWLKSYGNGPT